MPLSTPKSGESVARNWRFIEVNAKQIDALTKKTSRLQFLIEGFRKKHPLSGLGGWSFADPMEYDREEPYERDQVVVVSPENDAVTEGVSLGAGGSHGIHTGKDGYPNPTAAAVLDIALPGIWICLRNPKVLSETQPGSSEAPRNYDIHVPTWPLPSSDVDSEANYWMLLGFLPVERTWCDEDGPHQYLVQAVMIPEIPEEV